MRADLVQSDENVGVDPFDVQLGCLIIKAPEFQWLQQMKVKEGYKIGLALKVVLGLAVVRLVVSASTLHAFLTQENYLPNIWQSTYHIRLRRKTVWGSNAAELFVEEDSRHANANNDSGAFEESHDKHAATASQRYSYARSAHVSRVGNGHYSLVLVLSARGNFEARTAIRETWASEARNVVFLVGGTGCMIPMEYRQGFACSWGVNDSGLNGSKVQLLEKNTVSEQLLLESEARQFGDVLLLPVIDTYRSLPRKLKLGYAWALEQTNASWFVKVDDDFYVHLERLERFLRKYKPKARILGRIGRNIGVDHKGKWAEHDWPEKRYPPFPFGSCGHAVSRDIAAEIVRKDPHEYQGEDTSIGIWFSGREDIQMTTSMVFTNRGRCMSKDKIVVGHRIAPEKMRSCHEYIQKNRSKA